MSLEATVKSIDNDMATVLLSDGQILCVSATACEGSLKVGTAVRILVCALGTEDAGRQGLAKELLNEILRA